MVVLIALGSVWLGWLLQEAHREPSGRSSDGTKYVSLGFSSIAYMLFPASPKSVSGQHC